MIYFSFASPLTFSSHLTYDTEEQYLLSIYFSNGFCWGCIYEWQLSELRYRQTNVLQVLGGWADSTKSHCPYFGDGMDFLRCVLEQVMELKYLYPTFHADKLHQGRLSWHINVLSLVLFLKRHLVLFCQGATESNIMTPSIAMLKKGVSAPYKCVPSQKEPWLITMHKQCWASCFFVPSLQNYDPINRKNNRV